MSGLRVKGLTKAFGSTTVLVSLDLHVTDGITAVLGPSGCGKTTLLRLVAGFLDPDAGTIAIGDRVVAGEGRPVPARLRRVGYVPQEGALFPHLDVTANVGFGLPRGERGGARVREVLDLVELAGLGRGALPPRAVGRPAAARSARSGPRAGSCARAARRAVLLPRRRSARGHRSRRGPGASRERSDGRAGHPRPGRGAVAGRPGGRDVGGPVPPGVLSGRHLPPAGLPGGSRVRRPRHAPARVTPTRGSAWPPATSDRSRSSVR